MKTILKKLLIITLVLFLSVVLYAKDYYFSDSGGSVTGTTIVDTTGLAELDSLSVSYLNATTGDFEEVNATGNIIGLNLTGVNTGDDDIPDSGDLGIIDTESKFELELFSITVPSELNYYTDSDIDGNEMAFEMWDKNVDDDFDGDFGSLASIPAGLSDGDDVGDLSLDSTPNPAFSLNGLNAEFICGEAINAGKLVYVNEDSTIKLALANSAGTMPAIGIAFETGAIADTINVLLQGIIRNDSLSFTAGNEFYASDSLAGSLTQTIPSNSGAQAQILGIAISENVLYFNPQTIILEIE